MSRGWEPSEDLPKAKGSFVRSSQNVATLVGFSTIVLWLIAPLLATPVYYFFTDRLGIAPLPAWGAVIFGHNLVVVVGIPVLVLFWEREPLSSIGLRKISQLDILSAVIVFLVFNWITGMTDTLLFGLRPPSTPDNSAAGAVAISSIPIWFSSIRALTNGAAEEMSCRGYAIERLEKLTGITWLAASIACTADILWHYPVWGLEGTLAMAPGQILFTYFYVKRRSLPASMIAHILANMFATVVWPLLPVYWQYIYWRVTRF